MIEHYGQRIIRWRYLVLLITFLLTVLAAAGLYWLKFEADYRVFFKKDNPELLAFDRIQDTYAKDDNVLFVLAPKDGQVFTRETLQAVAWLTKEAWQTPYSNRVDSITNFQHTYAIGDDIIVQDLVPDASALTEADIARIREIALGEPQLVNNSISPEAHVTAVNITIQLQDENANQATPEVVAFARGLERVLRADYPHIEVYMTGLVTGNNAFLEISQRDMATLVPAMFLIIVVILWLLLHSFFGVIATILVIVFSTVSAVGLAGWLGITMTAISNSAPVVILTLAIANSVHILTTFRRLLHGREKNAAIMESLRINFTPVFLVSLTTAIGFLSLNFGEIPPLRDLGNIVAVGVVIAFLLSVAFLPALIATFPAPPAIRPSDATGARVMAHFGEFVIRKRWGLMWSMLGVSLVLIGFLARNDLDDEYLKYYGEDVDFRIASDFTIENLTGLQRIHYSLDAGEEWGIGKQEFLKKMAEFAAWYREQPEVIHVDSIIDTLKQLNRNMHGDDPAYYRLPERRDLVAQYLLFYEMSLPYGLDLNNQINLDKSATRLVVTLDSLSDNRLLAVEARAQQWLQENAPPSMRTPGVSVSMIFASVNYHNLRSLLLGAVVALVLISLILVIASRSVKFGLISMIPNLVPMAMAFGLWGMLVAKINLGLSAVALITMGIVVDDTIHFLNKYLHARREEQLDPPDAVRYAFNNVGVALWTTSLTLIAGFLVLTFSPFYVNFSMGIMTAITIALALVTDFLLLPPLLMKWDKAGTKP
uniref:SSD domain-containing protein n=1 Tax=Candidatus Kentrum sp. UNK TaxID=2126344 RepID=A0A451AAN4_9GAMM|nr:MAG: hypothetical protein BECKUNK1418G_GA0071005_102917 [Candidatus Kentron sp. UNK]VFK70716.1 MAG: hypothetical protein BECKUNK1418H_GA0071006_103617 [Candidatus Kentron sp. UNK]